MNWPLCLSICINIDAAILIFAHTLFFVLEWNWLRLPGFRAKLGFTGPQEEVALVGKNQAFSNLILAAGVVFGWIVKSQGIDAGNSILLFFFTSIALAGVVGFGTIPKNKKGFLIAQTIPGLAGIVLVLAEHFGWLNK